ncbi:protein TIC 62, chloroplastic [Arachis stenosperma]|uniref:protein TIC 62, chloroplastic n=1 Tax=Arachis stenosperma TaxID=217475 RepID=UPI0025AD9B73|nr:protein TIC 62, chloroplastic [Arachis stenosperma]XP_057746038.1 protein TIC 62, chloroplastic [Arachis stenosperma]
MPMESFSLQSLTPTTIIPSSLSPKGAFLSEKPCSHVKLLKHSDFFMRYPCSTSRSIITKPHKFHCIRAQASGSTKIEGIPEKTDSKDDNLVFVAGATGKVGLRTVRELIKLGFKVRAGVRSAERAGPLIKSVEQMKLDDGTSGGSQAVEKLEIVECDLEKPDQIGPALGNASTVICSIGASEKEVFDITGPYRIDYRATKSLIDAATVAKVNHFILVTSLGTNKFGLPAAILNLFWGVLIWKRKAEEALLASGLPYTIVRPGGMERPTDSYKETHNLTLSTEDTLFGGQVSNLQVAELMAVMAKNPDLAYCKIVEVVAETTAPLTPTEELLAKIPSQRPYISSPKKPDAAAISDPAPSEPAIATATEMETAQPKPVAKQPLSPYTVYEDLKPPSSPSPSKPGVKKDLKIIDSVQEPSPSETPSSTQEIDSISQTKSFSNRREFLSPYAAYEDLKPPTSPCPTPSTSNADSAAKSSPSKTPTFFHSPYHVYADLKPPTSPSPRAPNASSPSISAVESSVSQIEIVPSNGPPQLPEDEQHLPQPKSTPLSPYTMYEDLKPPASPSPAFRKS